MKAFHFLGEQDLEDLDMLHDDGVDLDFGLHRLVQYQSGVDVHEQLQISVAFSVRRVDWTCGVRGEDVHRR